MRILAGVLVVAAMATAGDYVWYTFGVRHTIVAGLAHGALLLTAVGAVIGAASGRVLRGLPLGTIAGLGAAASYYVLVAMMDRRTYGSAIPAAWVIMWLLLAALDGRWLRKPQRRTWPAVVGRGVAAAVLGGVSFFLVMNILWGRPPAGGRNYLVQFLAWTFAWAPGLLALTMERRARATNPPRRRDFVRDATATASSPAIDDAPAESSIAPGELLERIERGESVRILDVRSPGEFAAGHVPGAVNIPFTEILSRISDVPGAEHETVILYCGHGPRAYLAAAALRRGGRSKIVYMRGHWAAWQDAGLTIERT